VEDLARIVAVMFGAWIASGFSLALLAFRPPAGWTSTLRLSVLLVMAAVFVFLTGALFGLVAGASALVPAAIAVYLGARRR
jgi:hypothetical protein